jgi:hypothetical protein
VVLFNQSDSAHVAEVLTIVSYHAVGRLIAECADLDQCRSNKDASRLHMNPVIYAQFNGFQRLLFTTLSFILAIAV